MFCPQERQVLYSTPRANVARLFYAQMIFGYKKAWVPIDEVNVMSEIKARQSLRSNDEIEAFQYIHVGNDPWLRNCGTIPLPELVKAVDEGSSESKRVRSQMY